MPTGIHENDWKRNQEHWATEQYKKLYEQAKQNQLYVAKRKGPNSMIQIILGHFSTHMDP